MTESGKKVRKWPKHRPEKTEEQKKIDVDWQTYWLDHSRNQYSAFIDFGHRYVIKHSQPGFISTLDIGAGMGDHLSYENLAPIQKQNYWANEVCEVKIKELKQRWPFVNIVKTDCQEKMSFGKSTFDRILAIHVLEHLDNLPLFFQEANRLLKTDGRLLVVLPCEGWAYALATHFTSKKAFEARYKMDFREYMRGEHINKPEEILEAIRPLFEITGMEWWPFKIPSTGLNFCLGVTLRQKPILPG